jgi:nucleoside-diphosphate-sugar epimerase
MLFGNQYSKEFMNIEDKTLLITGIGGFIGLRATELAIANNMHVRGLQHSPGKAKLAQDLGAEVVIGSITDPIAAKEACQGVDIVLHTAALVKEGGALEEFREVNVGGTLNMANAAKNAGAKIFIHTSSVMVYGFNYPNKVTEEGPFSGDNNPYCQTKIEAEKELLKLNSPDFGVIIIRPADVYGPGSHSWVIRPLSLMHQRKFFLANGGSGVMNHVYIDNLIDAIFLAIEKEAYGEAFNITDGQETTWKEYATRLAKAANLPKPFSLPASVVKFLIRLQCLQQKTLGQEVDILPESIDFLTRRYAYSIEKAKNQLGYTPNISLDQGMEYVREWLQKVDVKQL